MAKLFISLVESCLEEEQGVIRTKVAKKNGHYITTRTYE